MVNFQMIFTDAFISLLFNIFLAELHPSLNLQAVSASSNLLKTKSFFFFYLRIFL